MKASSNTAGNSGGGVQLSSQGGHHERASSMGSHGPSGSNPTSQLNTIAAAPSAGGSNSAQLTIGHYVFGKSYCFAATDAL